MARKDGSTLAGRQRGSQRVPRASSWVAIGADTSLTACSVVAVGYDGTLDKMVGPHWAEIRWLPEDDYFKRLGQAAKAHDLILDVLAPLPMTEMARVYIACEEPFYFGATKKGQSAWLKQQAEIAGSFKGSLVRYGFLNIYEINQSQWKAAVAKELGMKANKEFNENGKWLVKEWCIEHYGLPDLPDLVKSKSGAKIPRPESGFGAKAKPIQPNDCYDACGVMHWLVLELKKTGEVQ